MTDALRDELARLGEGAAPVAVAEDVWARGRRARRRDRVVTATAVLSALLVLGGVGLALGLPGRTSVEPVSPDDVGAVPSVIHGVPQRLIRNEGPLESWRDDVESTDLAVGRASVAFNAGEYQPGPVVITAADGAYHLLELPGWLGSGIGASMLSGSPLALSPDGRQLAYAWWDPTPPFDGPMPSGVRVLDLESGKIRTIRLEGRDGVLVGALVWSPDSRWLAWQGRMQTNWTADNVGSRGRSGVLGRIAAGSEESDPVAADRRLSQSLAIDDEGDVLLARSDGWQTRTDSGVLRGGGAGAEHLELASEDVAGAVAPDGMGVAFRGWGPVRAAQFLAPSEPGAPPGRDTRVVVSRDLPDERYPAGAVLVDPLGWVDDDHVVVRVQPTDSEGGEDGYSYDIDHQHLVVMSAPWAAQERYDVVSEVEAAYEQTGGIHNLSVAVDLMTLEDPTHDFPEPEWPMSDERKVAISAGVVLALLAGVLVVRRLRRR